MDSSHRQFRYALIPLSQANQSAEWLLDDNSEQYIETDIIDMHQQISNTVFSQYTSSYKGVDTTRPYMFASAIELFEYNRWILFYEDGDPEKTIICFCLYKTTAFGLKSTLSGTNGSNDAKRCMLTFKTNGFNTDGVYGEVSDPLESRIINDVPVVPFSVAKRILAELGKTDLVECDSEHYSRVIEPIGKVTKVMVGRPYID